MQRRVAAVQEAVRLADFSGAADAWQLPAARGGRAGLGTVQHRRQHEAVTRAAIAYYLQPPGIELKPEHAASSHGQPAPDLPRAPCIGRRPQTQGRS